MLAVADQLPVVMLGEIGASRPPSRSQPEPEASAGTASASKAQTTAARDLVLIGDSPLVA
jgi:hypothetical protein